MKPNGGNKITVEIWRQYDAGNIGCQDAWRSTVSRLLRGRMHELSMY
jgi:hypothetical protein